MSVVGTVPWRIVAGRAWAIAIANCSEQKDYDNLERHLDLRLKPIVHNSGTRSGYKAKPVVKGQMGRLNG